MDNCKGSKFAAVMHDGRLFTDYRGNCQVRQLPEVRDTEKERLAMIAVADELIKKNEELAAKRALVAGQGFIHPDFFGHEAAWEARK